MAVCFHFLYGFRFQHTAARRRLFGYPALFAGVIVSTHSRPKAADRFRTRNLPEQMFQHTAARRRLKPHPTTSKT